MSRSDPLDRAYVLNRAANCRTDVAGPDSYVSQFEEALALAREGGDAELAGGALRALATAQLNGGNYQEGTRLLREGLRELEGVDASESVGRARNDGDLAVEFSHSRCPLFPRAAR